MKLALAFATALVAGLLVLAVSRPLLASPLLARANHRGREVPTGGGLLAVVALFVAAAAWMVANAVGDHRLLDGTGGWGGPAVAGFTGFAFLGLVDDLLGSGADGRGLRGHLRSLRRGRLTTGGVKLLGGLALAAVVAGAGGREGVGQLTVNALLVALAANLGNLLDRAPGRVLKVSLAVLAVLLVLSRADGSLLFVSMAVGATAALLLADLGEALMLGDTGANALGAVLGLGVVATASYRDRVVVVVALVALNLLSEVVSFSRIIEAVAPLRWVDRAGRARG